MGYNLDEALLKAAGKWDIDAVIQLVEKWADVNFCDDKTSVLEQACLSWKFDIVEYLVENNVDVTDGWSLASLDAAAKLDNVTIYEYLKEKGARPYL